MSLSLLVQLATGNQQGRSQPDKECANDPSNGAHPPRAALAFGRQPRGAPDRRLSVAASGSAVGVMYTFGWPILMTEHGLEGGDVAINARLPGFALGAKLESVEASVPASRVAGRVVGAQLLGQNEDRASVGCFRERKADDVGAPGEGHSAGRVPLQHAAGQRGDVQLVEVVHKSVAPTFHSSISIRVGNQARISSGSVTACHTNSTDRGR